MHLRRALIEQNPSLQLQRLAADEIAKMDKVIEIIENHFQSKEYIQHVPTALEAKLFVAICNFNANTAN